MRKSSKRKPAGRPKTYNVFNELLASPTEPLPQAYRTHQLTRMYEGLHALETAENPSTEDWRVVSDAVNMLETLVVEMQVCEDASGLLQDAVNALAALTSDPLVDEAITAVILSDQGTSKAKDNPGFPAAAAALVLAAGLHRRVFLVERLIDHEFEAGEKFHLEQVKKGVEKAQGGLY